jgi:site-specific recombinase XerC
VRLQLENRKRDLAMFNLAVDSKLRGCDLVRLKIDDVSAGGRVRDRATVIQKKTRRRFSSKSPSKPEALSKIGCPTSVPQEVGTCSRAVSARSRTCRHASTRASSINGFGRAGLDSSAYGTHSMRRTEPAQIYKKTGKLRAVQLLLGHTKLESTVRYLGIEVDDALSISEQVEL